MLAFVRIVVQVIDPGAVHGAHIGDEVVDRICAEPVFSQCILHTVFTHPEFVDVSEGICRQLQGHAVEGAICKFDGKGFLLICLGIYQLDAVEDGLVVMVVPGYVQGLA
jgi:hypothetical protein